MGLTISPDCWQGGSHSFTRWRVMIAKACGIPLMLMDGFYQGPPDWHPLVKEAQAYREHAGIANKPPDSNEPAPPAVTKAPQWDALGLWALDVDESLPLPWSLYKGDPIVPLLQHPDDVGSIAVDKLLPLAERLQGVIEKLPDVVLPGHIGNPRVTTRKFIAGLRRAHAAGEPARFS